MNLSRRFFQFLLITCCAVLLAACASTSEQLNQGKAELDAQNYEQAFKTLKPLAEKGNPDAQYAVGYMYYYGKGVIEDPIEARSWMQKAAVQGQPLAIQALKLIDAANPQPKTAPLTAADDDIAVNA